MLKKLGDKLVDYGPGAAGDTASDFHASGKYKFIAKNAKNMTTTPCIRCGTKLSKHMSEYCFHERYPYICSTCHLELRKQSKDLRKYCLYARCSHCRKDYFYNKADLARIFNVDPKIVDESFVAKKCQELTKCDCILMANDYVNTFRIMFIGRLSCNTVFAHKIHHRAGSKSGYSGFKIPRYMEKIKVKSRNKNH